MEEAQKQMKKWLSIPGQYTTDLELLLLNITLNSFNPFSRFRKITNQTYYP